MKASRMARRLGLDRNPLRRGTDRVEAWLILMVTLVLLVGGPLVVWQASAASYRGTAAAAARDLHRQQSFQVTAVLRDDAAKYVITNGDASTLQGPVPARWTAPDGTTHDGAVVPPSAGDRSGDPVTISTDIHGNVTQAPPPADPMASALGTGVTVGVMFLLVAMVFLIVCRWLLNRRRMSNWQGEWLLVERRWSGRR
jgi:hypothetical protein